MRDFSQNNQFNVMVRGGGQRVRYMALLDYKNEFGLLNEDYTHSDRYNSQIRNYELDLRINLSVDVTPSNSVKFSLMYYRRGQTSQYGNRCYFSEPL